MKPAFSPVEFVQPGLGFRLFFHHLFELLRVFESILELSILETRFHLESMWQRTAKATSHPRIARTNLPTVAPPHHSLDHALEARLA